MLIKRSQFLLALIALLYSPVLTTAQEPKADIVRVRTRVVFVDTLVQDKKTGAPVADLTRENFEVLADGKPRTLSYFSRAGEGRRRRWCSRSTSGGPVVLLFEEGRSRRAARRRH